MSGAQARRFAKAALAFEGVTQAPHMDRAAFRARRIFVTLAALPGAELADALRLAHARGAAKAPRRR